MKAKTPKVLEACIETGIEFGWRRAHKHGDIPTEEYIKDCISEAIWYEIFNWFDFGEDQDVEG